MTPVKRLRKLATSGSTWEELEDVEESLARSPNPGEDREATKARYQELRNEVWEAHAPAQWQGGECPFSSNKKAPWPEGLSTVPLKLVLLNAKKLVQVSALLQEHGHRYDAWASLLGEKPAKAQGASVSFAGHDVGWLLSRAYPAVLLSRLVERSRIESMYEVYERAPNREFLRACASVTDQVRQGLNNLQESNGTAEQELPVWGNLAHWWNYTVDLLEKAPTPKPDRLPEWVREGNFPRNPFEPLASMAQLGVLLVNYNGAQEKSNLIVTEAMSQ